MERMDQGMPFLLKYENVAWYEDGKVRILDRRVYPTEVRFAVCTDYREVVQAIADMVTQSAGPYTAVGMGMALAAHQVRGQAAEKQIPFLRQAADELAHARPTQANRYGQITSRATDIAEAALLEGKDAVILLGKDTKEAGFKDKLLEIYPEYRAVELGNLDGQNRFFNYWFHKN